jgi:cytidylate kinase
VPNERLQKILSNAGVASRRQAEAMIVAGRVAVNGKVLTQLGSRADPETDVVTLDGEPVIKSAYVYLLLNKPAGVVTSARDERGRKTVLDFAPSEPKLHPIGRLDVDSEGLVILTNDGELTNRLTHPKFEVDKEYLVGVHLPVSKSDQRRMVRGIEDGSERLRAASVRTAEPDGAMELPRAGAWLLMVLRQGRNREIRRMMAALERRVVHLRRIRIGPLSLGQLPVGQTRQISHEEVAALYKASKQQPSAPMPGGTGEKIFESPKVAATPQEKVPRVVALDGTAASGKSTLGQQLAKRFGHALLDTGGMYRAFTLAAQRAGIPADDLESCRRMARGLDMRLVAKGTDSARIFLTTEDVTDLLRAPEVEGGVSDYASIPAVRERLVDLQRKFAEDHPCIMVGRDIGTVVLPDAPAKIFLTASVETRGKRRRQQAAEWGVNQAESESRADISGRDKIDSTRATSPLEPADDAVVIDTTNLTPGEVVAAALEGMGCASD